MKNYLALWLFLFGSYPWCLAQKSSFSIVQAGINTEASFYNFTARIQMEPFVAYGTQKNQLIMAPTILVASNMGFQSSQIPKVSGVKVGYRFWPGTLNKRWTFYLANDLRFQRVKDSWKGNSFNEELSQYQETDYRVVEILIDNYLGYGVVLKITEHLSINQGVGIGAYVSSLNGNNALADEISFDYRGYSNFGFTWKVNFGLHVNF